MFISVKVREYQGSGMFNYGTVRRARVWKVFGFVVWKQWLDEDGSNVSQRGGRRKQLTRTQGIALAVGVSALLWLIGWLFIDLIA